MKQGETSPDWTGWEVAEKQPGRKVGSESERVSKNGQEGVVTGNFAVGDDRVRSIGGLLFDRSPLDRLLIAQSAKNKETRAECAAVEKSDEVYCGIVPIGQHVEREIVKNRKRKRHACHVTNVLLMAMQASDSHLASRGNAWKKKAALARSSTCIQ